VSLARTVEIARAQIGTTEVPFGSNRTVYGSELTDRYGPVTLSNGAQISRDGQEWCATFVAWCWHAGHGWPAWGLPVVDFYTPADRNAWRAQGLWSNVGQVGDHIYFDWTGDGTVDHVGLIVDDLGGSWRTIEGNVSNAVQMFIRPKNWRAIAGYGRTPYSDPPVEDIMVVLLRDPSRLAVYAGIAAHSRTWVRDEAQLAALRAAYPALGDTILMSVADQRTLYGPRLGPLPEDNGFPGEAEQ
jgi:hypothetical protein